uniref:Down syndrome cell adhesion molecule-like protein Dscam2 n=1 Tax=Dermatophagoides pteronyssinus TaxID=6956 RepID=A0A6P6XSJ9_DERPT
MDQPSSQSSSASQSASSTVIVISGQRTKLLCPLIDQTKLLTNKKLLPSSAANSVVVVHHQDGTSSTAATIIPIKWQKENSILPYDHRQHIQPNGTLIIQSSQKRLDEGSYYCYFDENFSTSTVTDNNGKKSNNNNINAQNKDFIMKNGAATVHLKVMDPPHVAPFEFPADLQIGMKARAMCSVMRGDQPFRFYWTQDGHRLESDLPTEDTGAIYRLQHFRDYSMLTVDSLTLAHAGNITCTVSNDAARTSQSSLLKVNAPPQWLIEPKDTQVILHQSVRIDCLASGSPKPFTTWKRAIGTSPWEYIPIYNSIHYYLHSNGSLQIKSATHQQSGQYICQSTNGYGTDIGKLIHLKINEPPRFQITIQQQSAHKDRPVRLICPPEGDHPIHMEWFQLINDTNRNLESLDSKRDNHGNNNRAKISLNANDNFNDKYLFEIKEISRKFLSDERQQSTSKSSSSTNQQKSKNLIVSILTIRKPTRLDSSLFLCKASNEYGWAEMKIRLIVKEKPDVPEKFSIQNVTESRTEIRWHESFNGNSNIVNYVVQYRLITNPSTTTRNDNQISSSSTSTTDSSINVLDMD